MKPGDRIYYTGDAANIDGYGRVTSCHPRTEYEGDSVNITMTDGREWRHVGLASFLPHPGRRFWLLSEWQADQNRKMIAAQAQMRAVIDRGAHE